MCTRETILTIHRSTHINIHTCLTNALAIAYYYEHRQTFSYELYISTTRLSDHPK